MPVAAQDRDPRPALPSVLREHRSFALPLGVLIVGLLVTGALVLVSHTLYNNNEKRLLDLRVRQVGVVLVASVPAVQTPLASAVALADATNGNVEKFTRFITPYVGPAPVHSLESVSLWRLGAANAGPVAVVGIPPLLNGRTPEARTFFERAARMQRLTVMGLRATNLARLGYALATPQPDSRFVVYAESVLPPNRHSRLQSNSAFSDLDYAIYLGARNPANLLVTSLAHLPIRGRQAQLKVPFGDTALTVVVSPRGALAGTLPQRLPWIIAIAGLLLSLGAAALTARLVQRRLAAEDLAGRLELAVDENQRLYAEQRGIAQTLQHALLPEDLPLIDGAEASAHYEPGERGMEIGGDWYDVIPLDERRLLLVVGDVSGRGLSAASTMASLRFAIHAYAAQDDPPDQILTKLSRILSVTTSGHLATVLCALVEVKSRKVTLASAGHLPPLLINGTRGEYVQSQIGLPIGVKDGASYSSTTISAPPAATFLAFTDGLVERRGENLDLGLARLKEAAIGNHLGLADLLDTLVADLRRGYSEDDTAIVGLRWTD